MEPNKFENQIKDKLEARTIQPSSKAWDRLDAMLSVEEQPKKKSFTWYYVAASLFFVFGITYWFINQDSEVIIPQNSIVTTENNEILEIDLNENSNESTVISKGLIENVKAHSNTTIVENKFQENKKSSIVKTKNNVKNSVLVPNQIAQENNNLVENNKEKTFNNQSYISPEKLLASVENNQENITITNSKNKKNSVVVDANSLLTSVESEITEEYRESTFDMLKRRFNEAKTAVANRNYE